VTDAQLWLPFDTPTEKLQEIDWSMLPHFEKPTTDNAFLLEAQYQYRVNGKQEALRDIFDRAEPICRKIVSKFIQEHKGLRRLSPEERKEKAFDATVAIIQRYLRRPRWFVRDHFITVLYRSVQHELLYKRKVVYIVDFVDWL